MTPDQADWVRDNVLPWQYLDDHAYYICVTLCRCQYGLCGSCGRDRHDLCLDKRGVPASVPQHESVLRNGARRLNVKVWLADRRCRYRCPCPQCLAASYCPALPPPRPPDVQLDLMDLIGAAA